MGEELIQKAFVHVGNSITSKSLRAGLAKVLEMNSVIYYSFAWSDDWKSFYILSK